MDTCIAIIMFAGGYFCCLLVNKILYIKYFFGDLPAMNICLHAKFKFSGVTVLAVQLFNKIKRKKKTTLYSVQ